MDEIVDVNSSIPINELASPYSHLQDIDFHEIRNGKVELLLESDLHQAYQLQDLRTGEQGDPSGLRTFLGWTIYGTNGGDQEIQLPKMIVNFLACEEKPEDNVKKYWKFYRKNSETLSFQNDLVFHWRTKKNYGNFEQNC